MVASHSENHAWLGLTPVVTTTVCVLLIKTDNLKVDLNVDNHAVDFRR